jgi:competence protein ComEC
LRKILPFPQYSFVWICVSIVIGLCIGPLIDMPLTYFVLSLALFSLGLAFFFVDGTKTLWKMFFIVASFVVVGSARTSAVFNNKPNLKLEKNSVFLLEIIETPAKENKWNRYLVSLREMEGEMQKQNCVLFLKETQSGSSNSTNEISKGNEYWFVGDVNPIKNNNNPGEFNAEQYWESKNYNLISFADLNQLVLKKKGETASFMDLFKRLNFYLGEVLDQTLSPEKSRIAKALLLGDKTDLSDDDYQHFGNAGAMHLLAVSGLHVGLILHLLMGLFGQFPRWISKYRAAILAILILWCYACLTGLSASVTRAVFMFSLLTIAQVSGRIQQPVNVLFFSAFVLLMFNPNYLVDIGFQLSYLAMLGIFVLYKPLSRLYGFNRKWMNKIWLGTIIGVSAQVFTVPLTLYYFHYFPNYFVLTNIGLLILAEVILFSGVLFLSCFYIPIVSKIISFLLGIGLLALLYFVDFIDSLPFSVSKGYDLTKIDVLIVYGFLILVLYHLFFKYRYSNFVMGGLIFFCLTFLSFQKHEVLSTDKLYVFNSSQPVISVKVKDRLFCFYKNSYGRFVAEKLMKNLNKIDPTPVEYCYLNNRKFEIKTDKSILYIHDKKNSITIEDRVNKMNFSINSSSKKSDLFGDNLLNDNQNEQVYNLSSNGCFILDL